MFQTKPTISVLIALFVALIASPVMAQIQPDADPTQAWSAESDWDIPGEYVVDFQDDVDQAAIESLLSTFGVRFQPTMLADETRIGVVKLPLAAARMLAALRGDARVESIEPHAKVAALFVPNDPMYDKQWHMKRVQSERAWGSSIGRGVTVAVIDTGIACESLGGFKKASDLATTRCVRGKSFVRGNKYATDDHGHGTHVAGTIAQSTDNGVGVAGLAFGARLMPVKVLSSRGWGTTTQVADGIRWAADNGAQVINLSLGGPRNSAVLQSAVDHARSRGVVVVAAAGNSGGSVGFPGGSRGVIGVSATDSSNALAWFSSRGKGVDIAAPGVNVVQQTICDRGRNGCELFPSYNGTSMASPHVAAAAAMLVSLGVSRPAAVDDALFSATKVLDDSAAGRKKFGNGLLQAADANEHVVGRQLLTRALSLLLFFVVARRWAGRRDGKLISAASPGLWIGMLISGVGALFFAPWILSRHELWIDVLSRPFGEWDMFVGASVHRFLPLANVLLPLGLVAVLLRKKTAPWLAGFTLGTGAYLLSIAALGQLGTPFGWLLTTIWCAVNALGCLFLASLLMNEQR